jgi:type I restriction enzyme, S subunit
MTMIDWDKVRIEDLGDIIAGGTSSRGIPSYWNGCIPWVTPSEITELRDKYLRETREHITAEGLAGSAAKLLSPGSVLVTTRATLGEAAITAVPVATNQGFKSIIPNTDSHSLYIYYLIRGLKAEMERLASGTTFLEISKADFARIKVRRPKHDEQARIAAVLDTVDEAIARTEAVIAKLKQVRAGLHHDLLTSGLDEHGQLRDPLSHPEQFQDSSLGRIPRDWRISTLGAELPLQRGFDITVAQQREGEVPVVSSSGITSYHDTAMVVGPGVVTGRKGKLGEVFYIERNFWPHDTSLWVTDFHGNSARFTAFCLGQMRLERFDAATSVPTLNRNTIHPLHLVLPSRPEQERIVSVVETWDEFLATECKWLDELIKIKSGLMADLLTGRVRVPESISGMENQL